MAAESSFDSTMTSYMVKMLISLLVLIVLGMAAIKFLPGKLRVSAQGKLRLIGTLMLGRDAVHLVQAGPSVVALFVSRTGATVVERWTLEQWREYEAESTASKGDVTDDVRSMPR